MLNQNANFLERPLLQKHYSECAWRGKMARGSPSLANGAGLRTPSLRGSWVRIPPPAPKARVSWLDDTHQSPA
jgi:hypothetical protein